MVRMLKTVETQEIRTASVQQPAGDLSIHFTNESNLLLFVDIPQAAMILLTCSISPKGHSLFEVEAELNVPSHLPSTRA